MARNEPIGDELGRLLAPHLLDEYDAGLELGLSIEAIERAEQQGLRAHDTSFGRVYWRPSLHRWAARVRRFVPVSYESQALHLADLLGFDTSDGVIQCGFCESREVEPPRVAFRRCYFCSVALCVSDACGGSFVPDGHDLRTPYPFACVNCIASRRVLRMSASAGYLPGFGDYPDQLAKRFETLRRSVNLGELLNLRDIVLAARDEAIARGRAIAAELKSEPELAGWKFRPDVFHNLRVAQSEAARHLAQFGKLLAMIEGALHSTNTDPEQ